MKQKLKIVVYGLLLTFFWLIPLVYHKVTFDAGFIKIIVSYGLLTFAAYLCFLLQNRHVALILTMMFGAGICLVSSIAAFDIIPVLLLCCWLRCYLEREKGYSVSGYLQLFTNLIYAYLVAVAVRIIRSGYALISLENMDDQSKTDLCLMTLVFCIFLVMFITGYGKVSPASSGKGNGGKTINSERRIVGVIPVYISLRTFWGFCAILLAVSLLQFTNNCLGHENYVFLFAGFRFLFLPWMILLLFSMNAFPPGNNINIIKRLNT